MIRLKSGTMLYMYTSQMKKPSLMEKTLTLLLIVILGLGTNHGPWSCSFIMFIRDWPSLLWRSHRVPKAWRHGYGIRRKRFEEFIHFQSVPDFTWGKFKRNKFSDFLQTTHQDHQVLGTLRDVRFSGRFDGAEPISHRELTAMSTEHILVHRLQNIQNGIQMGSKWHMKNYGFSIWKIRGKLSLNSLPRSTLIETPVPCPIVAAKLPSLGTFWAWIGAPGHSVSWASMEFWCIVLQYYI